MAPFAGYEGLGPPPATPAAGRLGRLEPGTVIEVDRKVDQSGIASLGKVAVTIGYELANQRVMLRLDGHRPSCPTGYRRTRSG
ncbi:hypothetical protein [Streptomyces sp. NPDC127197]|uniref:hypothetical protein n=1 Tax=Streptomyces sp. NPDC127197 TaxID=3345388 RepID=UPI0036322E78